LIRVICEAVIDRKSVAVKILNLEGRLSYCDYFILCNGKAARQVRAIAENVLLSIKKEHTIFPLGVEGRGTDQWVIVDYGDVILHVFQPEMRSYYDLDGLWADAPILSLSDLGLDAPEAETHPEQPIFPDDDID
jgi:ribosome silencing factor RsfS/YbeB/iojap